MLLSVPYYSQHLDVLDSEWKDRACAVACIKMLLEAKKVAVPPLDEMIKEHGASGTPVYWYATP